MSNTRDFRWLIDLARQDGLISSSDRLDALQAPLANTSVASAWQLVCDAARLDPHDLAKHVASRFGMPAAALTLLKTPEIGAAECLPPHLLDGRAALPLQRNAHELWVAIADPLDSELRQLVQFATPLAVRWSIAAPQLLPLAIDEANTAAQTTSHSVLRQNVLDVDAPDASDAAIVKLCNQVITGALHRRASDIHIQMLGDGGVIRMRIDGVMQNVSALPRAVMLRLASRIKLLADMDPTNQVRCQDGALRVRAKGRLHDLRVSSVPANGAEKIVLRLLGGGELRSLTQAGLVAPELDQLSRLLSRSQGLVLLCGPTGSGKTTTLYSALAERNEPSLSITTVEDPVEIKLAGLAQIEVNAKAGITFATALRSVLRQDPDIILIGEIRDAETASIAVQAAMTGHLVLATLHANDAIACLPRLMDLGISPLLLAQALAGSCAQRLVRRLCEQCAQSVLCDDSDPAMHWLQTHADIQALRQPRGCPECDHTGYRGRLPLAQVLVWTPELAAMAEAGESILALRARARQSGMRSLAQSGLDRLRSGETSLAEVLRELGGNFWAELAQVLNCPVYEPTFRPHDDAGALTQLPPCIVIARDSALRHLARQALAERSRLALEAPDALQGRLLLERIGAVEAILIDLAGLNAENVRAFLAVRDTLGGAAVPILGLLDHDSVDPAMTAIVAQHTGVFIRTKPSTAQGLKDLLAQAIASLD